MIRKMLENQIGELVFKAKGERTYREYHKDSGVDAAVISKIVKGKYIQKILKYIENLQVKELSREMV